MHNFRRLQVYSRAIELSALVWKTTSGFPPAELYGLTSQFRRAANSIALNIAEGSGGSTPKEFARFLQIRVRSGYECFACIDIAREIGLLDQTSCEMLHGQIDEVVAMLIGLRRSLRNQE